MENTVFERSQSLDPACNLNRENELFLSSKAGRRIFLWRNSPSVILGKNQVAAEEADLRYAEEKNIRIIHRQTGGGAVYQDPGNINYSFITDLRSDCSLKEYSFPIIEALSGLGISADFSGRNDILVNGRKICGTACRIHGSRILVHGCILFSVDLHVMEQVLTPSVHKLARHGVRSVRSRVMNLHDLLPSMTAESFMDYLETALH